MSLFVDFYKESERLKDEGDLPAAIEKLQELLQLDESYALAHSALAVLCGKVGEHEKAIQHAQRVCELEPDDAFSFTALSVTFQRAFAGTQNHQYIQMAEDAMARSRIVGSSA
jgi:tetratricopeptide (TPR) repeat protein